MLLVVVTDRYDSNFGNVELGSGHEAAAFSRSCWWRGDVAYLRPSGPTILDPRQIEQFKVGLVENDLIVGKNVDFEQASPSPY